ncbi:response regulator [Bacillus solitudinis]|uniref:response regulator n=1 Tax=Bacillus solitudinis TaxID=2014074 RepID=UPI0018E244A7|nr:response regulator [Bacillus solitudinis]
MKIKTKLLLGLSALPILILLLTITDWYQLKSLNKISDSAQRDYELSFLTEQIYRDVKDEAISLRNLVIFDDEVAIENELTILQMKSDSIKTNISLLDKNVNTSEEAELLEDIKNINEKYGHYKDNLLELVAAGNKVEAIDLMNMYGHQFQADYTEIIYANINYYETTLASSLTTMLQNFKQQILIGGLIALIGILVLAGFMIRTIWALVRRLNNVSNVMKSVANGNADLSTRVEVKSNNEIDEVAKSFNTMVLSLEKQINKEQSLNWSKSNIAEITTSLSGLHDLESLSRTFLSKIVPLMNSAQAVFYVKDAGEEKNEPLFKLLATYAFKERKHHSNTVALGEGLVGQAALEQSPIILTNVPSDYIRVTSGLGEAPPLNLYVLPISFEGDVKAVLELASFHSFSSEQQTLLEEMVSGLGIILDSVMGRIRLARLLEESQQLMEEVQAQSEELQSQQEELRVTNEELEEQTQSLKHSEEKLQVQQEELEQTNAELEEKAKNLEEQNKKFELTNREVERARAELEEKARQLTLSSKYKSEFLANMSHELRTPLNSLLILSKLLADNHEGNLSSKQVEYSKTIYSSGNDLLTLINDILDLAKIESGKAEVNPSNVHLEDLVAFVEKSFRPIANEKKVDFNIILKDELPRFIYSDEQRLQQILKNLLSNAFKFTAEGGVTLEVSSSSSKHPNKPSFSFSIIDTGIGISKEKFELIFQAFQQADGTTSRKYGGTGLGLSICRELSSLLGGEIVVESDEGKGSTFTFYVSDYKEDKEKDKQEQLNEVAATNEKNVEHKPTDESNATKSIASQSYEANSNIKRLLIVDDDVKHRNSLMELIGDKNVILKAVSTGAEAIEQLKVNQFDCMVLDLRLCDTTGFELLEKIKTNVDNDNLKIFIYTGRNLTSKEELQLTKYAHTIIIKDVHSPTRLKDELELYLNTKSDKEEGLDQSEVEQPELMSGLEGKKILLVDDDIRNVYALSSILELYGMKITFAENGREGLEILERDSTFDLVLMDIMMPEMDGYEAIQRLRSLPQFHQLPVIALTAKAMKEDREKCIEVGASDYLIKPVQPTKLISLIRVWLHQQEGFS